MTLHVHTIFKSKWLKILKNISSDQKVAPVEMLHQGTWYVLKITLGMCYREDMKVIVKDLSVLVNN